jgi:hypothetical protein
MEKYLTNAEKLLNFFTAFFLDTYFGVAEIFFSSWKTLPDIFASVDRC